MENEANFLVFNTIVEITKIGAILNPLLLKISWFLLNVNERKRESKTVLWK
jgi:hypothetical protein